MHGAVRMVYSLTLKRRNNALQVYIRDVNSICTTSIRSYWISDHKTVVDKVALAARRPLESLITKSKEIGGFSAQTYSYLYSTLVMPVIDSCCVWGYENTVP